MGSHVDALNEKITEAKAEVIKLKTDIGRVKAELGQVLASDPVDDKRADKLQQKRDELGRALERAEIRLEALTREVPSAERLDGAARLSETAGEASALAKANEEARERYEAALRALAECVDDAYAPAVKRIDLVSEAQFIAEAYNLPLPSLPEVPMPEPAALKEPYGRATALYEQRFNPYSEWRSKLSEMQSQRKRERKASERQRERETGARVSL